MEIEPIKAPRDDGSQQSKQIFLQIADAIENECMEVPSSNDKLTMIPAIKLADPALEKELDDYRTALLKTLNIGVPDKVISPSSTLSMEDNKSTNDTCKDNSTDSAPDQQMINVRMIDGENFVTEWGDLVPPLPPPPDHGLHSPIVDTILNQWTANDSETQSSLISCIESILNGSNPKIIPSLKLSGLDHQMRDGFIIHVLPLILLHKDVHVNVASHAHHLTTYDIAVSVTQAILEYHPKSLVEVEINHNHD